MMHSIAGLNVDQVGLVVHTLNHTGNNDLASLFITTLALIDTTLLLILKEMFSTRKHILYWTELAKSPSWEIVLYRLNSVAFKKLFAQRDRDYVILDNSEGMRQHAERIRADLNELSILLEKVNAAASLLKAVYLQLNSMGGTLTDRRELFLLRSDWLDSEPTTTADNTNSLSNSGYSNTSTSPRIRNAPGGDGLGLSILTEEELLEEQEGSANAGANANQQQSLDGGNIEKLSNSQALEAQEVRVLKVKRESGWFHSNMCSKFKISMNRCMNRSAGTWKARRKSW